MEALGSPAGFQGILYVALEGQSKVQESFEESRSFRRL
jgi:hypothetical protein